jgi:hypothetical protein
MFNQELTTKNAKHTKRNFFFASFACFVVGLISVAFCFSVSVSVFAADRFGSGYEKFKGTECAWCGGTKNLEGHHIQTELHIRQRLEAGELTQAEAETLANSDPTNIITLCRPCHFCLGHLCNWHRENTNIMAMIKAGKGDTHVAPKESK